MTDQGFELSPSGFRLPYHRFLADIAAGIFAILLLVVAYYTPNTLIFRAIDAPGPSANSVESSPVYVKRYVGGNGITISNEPDSAASPSSSPGAETKVLVVILLGIATVPIGMILNGVGWFVLGPFQWWCVRLVWYRWRRYSPTSGTNRDFRRDLVDKAFDLKNETFHERAQLFELILNAQSPVHLDEYRHVKGLKTLVRSLGLLALIGGVLFWGVAWALFLACFITAALVVGLLEYYVCLAILSRTMALTLQANMGILVQPERWEAGRLLRHLQIMRETQHKVKS